MKITLLIFILIETYSTWLDDHPTTNIMSHDGHTTGNLGHNHVSEGSYSLARHLVYPDKNENSTVSLGPRSYKASQFSSK